MTIQPVQNIILVRRVPKDTQTSSGLIIPDQAQAKAEEGIVMAVGPGLYDEDGQRIPLSVKVGDRVLLGAFVGLDLQIPEDDVIGLRDTDVLAVLG